MGGGMGKRRGSAKYKEETKAPESPKSPVRSSPSVVLEEERVTFLSKVPLFKRLVRKQLCLIGTACTPRDFEASQEVIKQGDVGNDFYLIQEGSASVHVANDEGISKKVAVLQVGDYFGERALLHDVPRTASIIAETRLSTLQLTREQFQVLGLQQELQVSRRKAIGGGAHTTAKTASPKTPEDRELIARALHDNFHLQNMCVLDDARVQAMIDFCWLEEVPAGKALIVEGDIVADYFYVVKEGAFDVLQVGTSKGLDVSPSAKAPARSAEKAASRARSLRALGPGGSFGELAMLCHAPRSATVQAMADSSVWVFDRDSFKNVLVTASASKIDDYVRILDKVEMLQALWPSERRIVAEALVEVHFEAGNPIMQEGEPGNSLYILLDGEVSVSSGGAELRRMVSEPSSEVHPFFGEKALLNDEPRSASVVAISDIVKTLVLDRTSFDLLLGPLQDIMQGNHASQESKPEPEPAAAEESKLIPMADLTRIGLLGCGSFGFVDMYEHKTTRATYALKGQGKGYIMMVGAQQNIVREKDILKMMDSPFIIRLYETYSNHDMIYFLLELALGGDLHTAYHRHNLWGSEKHARFYVAGVIIAFVSLHAVKVMYRDLKPENIMLTEGGHPKLTDMGLAKVVAGKTYTCCGTPDYFAPELLQSDGYTHAVDWWTVGILTFELMSGYAPFEAGNDAQIYRNIKLGIQRVKFPRKWRNVCSDFIMNLLRTEPSARMPMKVGGTKLLRLHKFYEGFDWKGFCEQKMHPPYLPAVTNSKDISNFQPEEEDKPEMIPFVDDGTGWDRDF